MEAADAEAKRPAEACMRATMVPKECHKIGLSPFHSLDVSTSADQCLDRFCPNTESNPSGLSSVFPGAQLRGPRRQVLERLTPLRQLMESLLTWALSTQDVLHSACSPDGCSYGAYSARYRCWSGVRQCGDGHGVPV